MRAVSLQCSSSSSPSLCVVSASTDPPQTAVCSSDSSALALPMRWLYRASVSKYCVVPGSNLEVQQQFFRSASDVLCSEQSLGDSDAFCSIQRNVWVICLNNGAESQILIQHHYRIFCTFGEKSAYSPVCSCCLKPRQMVIL